MKYVRPSRICKRCGKDKPHEAHGLCKSCYGRRYPRQDAPNGVSTQHHSRTPDAVASRIEDYALIRPTVADHREAALRLGVSYRTILRYNRRLEEESNT